MARSSSASTRSTPDSTPRETPPSATATASLVSHFARTFVTRTDLALRWTVAGKPHWYCSRTTLTRQDLEWALTGDIYLGLYAVGRTGLSRWLAIDADSEEAFRGVVSMASVLAPAGNVLVERSRRGGHIFLVCPPTPWQHVVAYGHFLKQEYGLQRVELYPPSGELKAIKAPGTRHPRSRLIYPFLDPQTGEVVPTLAEALATLTPRPLPMVREEAERVLEQRDPFSNVVESPGNTGTLPPGNHQDLMDEVTKLTKMRYFGPNKANGLCPWHADHHPSLAVVEGYFQCFAASCGVKGGVLAWKKLVRERGTTPR